MKGIIGFKLGMKQLFLENSQFVPVTIIQIKKNIVTQVKTKISDGYISTQLGIVEDIEFDRHKKLNKCQIGHLKHVKNYKVILTKEIRGMEGYQVGDYVSPDLFQKGEIVKVTAKSKGRGFQGVVDAHNFKKGPSSHGSSLFHRGLGSTGSIEANRVFKGKKMAGRHSNKQITIKNLLILDVNKELNYIILKGSVPGPKKRLLIINSLKIQKKNNKNFVPLLENQKDKKE
jgi:large subunit ribosomal protein L3